jgi:hypothetical protein
MRQTKFGVQPGKLILRAAGFSIADAALSMGVKQTHLHGALDGNIRPNEVVLHKLPKLVQRPVEELFTHEVLTWKDLRQRSGYFLIRDRFGVIWRVDIAAPWEGCRSDLDDKEDLKSVEEKYGPLMTILSEDGRITHYD